MPTAKVIVTAAVTGAVHHPSMSPYLPLTPQQIAEDAIGAAEAGAAVVHIHARNPGNGMPSPDLELFREILTGIKSKSICVICITTGGGAGMTSAQRAAPVSTFKPEMASVNMGSMNFSIHPAAEKIKEFKYDWEKFSLLASEDNVFPNTFKTQREFLHIFEENNTKPELEVYDLGMVNNIAFNIARGYLKPPLHIQFVTGLLGGVPSTVNSLVILYNAARDAIGPGNFTWSAIGAGRFQMPLCATALAMGGHVRVGMEDSLFISRGVLARRSAEQVEKIIRIMRELSLEPATPDEARRMLGLKGIDKVNF